MKRPGKEYEGMAEALFDSLLQVIDYLEERAAD
jgi:hypothetical protein